MLNSTVYVYVWACVRSCKFTLRKTNLLDRKKMYTYISWKLTHCSKFSAINISGILYFSKLLWLIYIVNSSSIWSLIKISIMTLRMRIIVILWKVLFELVSNYVTKYVSFMSYISRIHKLQVCIKARLEMWSPSDSKSLVRR